MKKIVVLTGAGISAESGISTFRDAGGLWEQYDIMEVASIEGWRKNSALVLDFYNQRRRQLFDVQPNAAHLALVALEKKFEVRIITQNVDDLHERAGSSHVLHLHGELRKVRSTKDENLVYQWDKDLTQTDHCELGSPLRPHIVWFGELVPMLETAIIEISNADIVLIIGTSLQVYPAASLVEFAPEEAPVFYIDPNVEAFLEDANFKIIAEKATVGVPQLVNQLLST